ncbi:MAG TPA: YCF48-related protein [Ignavibacteria bacterium]|nr:YCF48-related protein [Ignavibacteria bacterium]HMQ99939.1 YCF48-related protein [Ignavibacteria bacterium]
MKIIITLLNIMILLLLPEKNNLNAQTSFFWQHPLPTGNQLEAVKFINQQTGIAVGAAGTIMRTSNGGLNWEVQPSPVYAYLWDVTYVNANIWVIAGVDVSSGSNGIILRSTNGGTAWTIVQNQSGANYKGVDFPSQNAGYVVGAGTIHKSTDQGATWVLQPTGVGNFYTVDFYDDLFGAAAGINSLRTTTNGGLNWIAHTGVIENMFDLCAGISCIDLNTIIGGVQSGNDYIIKTTNGGLNWTNFHNFFTRNNEILLDLEMTNNSGFIVTELGRILRTTDRGLNWLMDTTFMYPILRGSSRCVNMLDEGIIYLAGSGGVVLKSNNSGLNWNFLTGYQTNLRGIQFLNSNTGYVSGDGGTILKTTNSGNNWQEINSGYFRNLHSLYFTDVNTGYAAGDSGIVIKTSDGGLNWFPQISGTDKNLLSICFANHSIGYATGGEQNNGQGVIIKTTNAGTNWFTQLSGSSMNFTSLFIHNPDSAFALTNSSLFKTSNGGMNWDFVSGVEGYDIQFTNAATGYAMGSNPNVYKTTNGGVNWFVISSGYDVAYRSIQFFDEFGITAGSDGSIMKTTNGGANWIVLPFVTENYLRSLYFTDPNTGYVVGYMGAILKTTNGGLSFLNSINEIIPKGYTLYQNYPNPFNPATKIKFEVPVNHTGRNSNTKLIVFDIQGKELVSLVDDVLSAGVYEVTFDSSLISSGIYFYRFETEDFSETRKMILMK